MKIEITPQTKIIYYIEMTHPTLGICGAERETLKEARDYADWAENAGYTNIKLELIAES